MPLELRMFKPKDSETIQDIRKARSLKELDAIIQRIGVRIKQRKSALQRLLSQLQKVFKFGVSLSAASVSDSDSDESIEVGTSIRPTLGKINPESGMSVISNWKRPETKLVQKYVLHVEDFYQEAYELDVLKSVLIKQYSALKKSRNAALKNVEDHLELVSESLNNALLSLESVSKAVEKQHAPKELKSLAKKLANHLAGNLRKVETIQSTEKENKKRKPKSETLNPKQYDHIDGPRLFVAESQDGRVLFHYYIVINGLVGANSYEFPEYYVVLTGAVSDTGVMRMYVTTMEEFGIPGKFNLGRQIYSIKDLLRTTLIMLAADRVISNIERKPLAVDKDQTNVRISSIPEVVGVKIYKDELFVNLTKKLAKQTDANAARKSDIIKEILSHLDFLVSNVERKKVNFQVKEETSRSGNPVIRIILTPAKSRVELEGGVSLTQFNALTQALNVDSRTAYQLKRFLAKHGSI